MNYVDENATTNAETNGKWLNSSSGARRTVEPLKPKSTAITTFKSRFARDEQRRRNVNATLK